MRGGRSRRTRSRDAARRDAPDHRGDSVPPKFRLRHRPVEAGGRRPYAAGARHSACALSSILLRPHRRDLRQRGDRGLGAAPSAIRGCDSFLRDPQSTIRSASIVPTLERIVRELDPELSGMTVLRYIQSPFVTVDTLEEAVATLAMSDARFGERCGGDPRAGVPAHGARSRDRSTAAASCASDFDVLYRDLQSCIATRNRNLATGSLTGRSPVSFVVSGAECFFIDSEHKLRSRASWRARSVDRGSRRRRGRAHSSPAYRARRSCRSGHADDSLPAASSANLRPATVVLATTTLAADDELASIVEAAGRSGIPRAPTPMLWRGTSAPRRLRLRHGGAGNR